MWNKLAGWLIQYRLYLMISIGVITVFMGYHAAKVEMSYDFARTVPPSDPDMIALQRFRQQFGEDANIIAVGMLDSGVYRLDNFLSLKELTHNIREIEGVNNVISLPEIRMILKDTAESKFYLAEVFPRSEEHTSELQSRENLVCRLLLEIK